LNLFYQPRLSEGLLQLDGDESQHAIKVLRHQPGDQILVTDGKGTLYICSIEYISKRVCSLQILRSEKKPKPVHYIHVALAPTKSSDRTEWFVEKAVEIGIQEITFLKTQHGERPRINLDRITKVAVGAIKQSGQVWLPKINDLTDFHTILKSPSKQKFIASVDSKNESRHLWAQVEKNSHYLVLIGPEGDFSSAEIQAATESQFTGIHLGMSTLRTETAGLVACHTLNLIHG
jgi:16S rRNA (uracil1498-N3)-methyltransferase